MAKKSNLVFGRFVIVGVFNTVLDVAIFMVLQNFFNIFVSNIIASATAMGFSFVANSRFTFSQKNLTVRSFILFVATTGLVMWLLQPIVIYGLNNILEPTALNDIQAIFLAKLLATGFSLGCNFAFYRYLIWPLKEKEENNG